MQHSKYRSTAEQQKAVMIPFVMETLGGIAPQAIKLLERILLACRDHLTLWPHKLVMESLMGEIAIAIQRGNAQAMIGGYTKAVGMAEAA